VRVRIERFLTENAPVRRKTTHERKEDKQAGREASPASRVNVRGPPVQLEPPDRETRRTARSVRQHPFPPRRFRLALAPHRLRLLLRRADDANRQPFPLDQRQHVPHVRFGVRPHDYRIGLVHKERVAAFDRIDREPNEVSDARRHEKPALRGVARSEHRHAAPATGQQLHVGQAVDQKCVQGGAQCGVVREVTRTGDEYAERSHAVECGRRHRRGAMSGAIPCGTLGRPARFVGGEMDTLGALLAGIVAEPSEETRWLVLADWLEENDDPRRAELLRLHRQLVGTCCQPDAHPHRTAWQARVVELLVAGVHPCVPRHTLELHGGVPLVGSFVPPGSSLMGGTVEDAEEPVHRVTLTCGLFMGVYPVTQAQWTAVMGTDPSHFKGPNKPVEKVSWDQSQKFCTKLTKSLKGRATVRLPTEAEWEYACRAGTTTAYHFGDVLNTNLANYNGTSTWNGSPTGENRQATTDVGSFPANGWGLHDVHGNVWEWCEDWFDPYPASEQTDPHGPSGGADRVLRGGSWLLSPRVSRSADRNRDAPTSRYDSFGFRVCFHPHSGVPTRRPVSGAMYSGRSRP
jgi:uncharacterized protein (TIGR02996 family)